jgi:hypothetical protein
VENTLVENLTLPEKVGNEYEKRAKELKKELDEMEKSLKEINKQLQEIEGAKKSPSSKKTGKDTAATGKDGGKKKTAEKDKAPTGKDGGKKKSLPEEAKTDGAKKAQLLEEKRQQEQKRRDLEEQWKTFEELKKNVRDRIAFVVLFQASRNSSLANKSVLASLVSEGGGGMPGANMPGKDMTGGRGKDMQAPGKSGAPEGKGTSGPNRSGWTPLGDMASTGLSAGGVGGLQGKTGGPKLPGPSSGERPAAGRDQPALTEFIVLMIWQEPLAPDGGKK